MRAMILAACCAALFRAPLTACASPAPADTARVQVFLGSVIRFHADSAAALATPGDSVSDRGRVVTRAADLPAPGMPYRVFADLTLHPIPKSDREVFDRWDRAGNIRLAVPGMPDLEVMRFMTSYGGETRHELEVSDLSPLLRGRQNLRAHVDTWVSPGWKVDFELRYVADTSYDNPSWAAPVYYTDSFNRQDMPRGFRTPVVIPPGLSRVVMKYVSTGHCTDGTDEDEFASKANVISVDGKVVARLHPWRSDCRRFRERNPYGARWTDGSWSSDYSRSGWCPGAEVPPTEIDLTDWLPQGRHVVEFQVEGMRPKDAKGNFGYWRVSSCLVGWDHPPKLWKN